MMDIELENLYKWVDEIPLSRSKKNISRDFSDCVLMAEILKYFFPRLVDLHNYPPTNTLASKITNWTTLNKKVLMKIGLQLTKEEIGQIAKASEGAIEGLLKAVCNKVKAEREKKLLCEQQEKYREQNVYIVQKNDQSMPVSGVPVTADVDSDCRVILVTEKMIPLSEIEDKLKELSRKDETITALTSLVLHCEQLLKMKDQRINHLLRQVRLLNGSRPVTSSENVDHSIGS